MKIEMRKRYNEAIKLLERWDNVIIPADVWTSPGEDFILPLDTQEFLKDVEDDKKVG